MDATARHILLGLMTAMAGATASAPAIAQEAGYLSEFERPYGFSYGSEQSPFDAGTRDSAGNRVVVNGLINGGTGLGFGMNTGWGQTDGATGMLGTGTAVGNQLNVITNGSNNTIIIDATQINNGDQNVVLNGELNLDE